MSRSGYAEDCDNMNLYPSIAWFRARSFRRRFDD